MNIERPDLIQAHRSDRNDHLLLKAIVGCLIGLTAIIALATASHAETVEAGIAPPDSGFVYLSEIPLTEAEQRMIFDEWTANGYDYALALAFADKETGGTFNKNAVNNDTHDYGLFQLNRASWLKKFRKMYGINDMNDMLDLKLNVKGALFIFNDCVQRYGNNEHAIVSYNRGITSKTSTSYSRDVLDRKKKWESIILEKRNEQHNQPKCCN